MKHYVIIESNVTDPAWVSDYLQKVTPMLEEYGGRYLTRTPNVQLIEGDAPPPQFSLLAEFPTKEAFEAFYHSSEYEPFKTARLQGSRSRMLLVPAEGTGT